MSDEADTQAQQNPGFFEALADLEADAEQGSRLLLEGMAHLGRASFTLGVRLSSKLLRLYVSSLRRAGEAIVPPFFK